MKKIHLGIDDFMPFGKHKGEYLANIAESDPGYIHWLNGNVKNVSLCTSVIDLAGSNLTADENTEPTLEYCCDNARHLICLPYSVRNLHTMAANLGINRCWFHRDHYDIPKKRIKEITEQCMVVSSKEIVEIINRKECAGSKTI